MDFVAYRGLGSTLQLVEAFSHGDGTFEFRSVPVGCGQAYDGYSVTVADVNGDGRADLVPFLFNADTSIFFTLISNGSGGFACSDGLNWSQKGWMMFTPDISGDGRSDIAMIAFQPDGALGIISFVTPSQPLLATSFTTGLGATTNVSYLPLTSPGVYSKGSGAVYPQQDTQGALYVVNRVDAPTGISNSGPYTSIYGYVGARFDLWGRGFLGFQQMNTYDAQTRIYTRTAFRQDFPFIGMVDWERKWACSSECSLLNETDNSYQVVNWYGDQSLSNPSVYNSPYRVRLTQSAAYSYDLDGTAMPTVTTTYQYDSYNNPTQVTVSTPDGFSKTTANWYTNDTTNWFLGRLYESQVTSTAPSQDPITRISSFDYNSSTGLLIREVIEPRRASLWLQTDYTYDGFGNKAQVTVTGADITIRSSSTSYASANGSANGQFPTAITNALSQTENWQYDLRFGKPTSHTGPNGLTTTWHYDSFGRKILEMRAVNTSSMTQTAWDYISCTPGACFPDQVYRVRETPLDSNGNQIGARIVIGYDALDREMYRSVQGFDGTFIEVQTVYDGFGRVQSKSRPFFWGGTPLLTTYDYDTLGRVTVEHLPDNNTIQHAYHGLVTSDTNQKNQTRTVTKNSQGQVVSVTDAMGFVVTYSYDPFGNLLSTVDSTGFNVISATYDLRGRKIASSDPDLGTWRYSYNVLNQLVLQTDAKGQSTAFSHDLLGRVVERDESDMMACWTYDTAQFGIGKLASARTITGGNNCQDPHASTVFQRSMAYDSQGRPCQVRTTIDGAAYFIEAGIRTGTPVPGVCNANAYDVNGRLTAVTYPSGFAVGYGYTSLGYALNITDARTNQSYWTANARDAELHLTQDTAGNGVRTARGFQASTGRLTSIVAGSGNGIADFSYSYDALGNPFSRSDGHFGVTETFAYDPLNRVTSSSINLSPTPLVKTFDYNRAGNLMSKSDVGTYNYPPGGSARPHGVTSITNGSINTTFSYDANGNQTSGLGRTIAYNAANKPASITQGALTLNFADDVDHQRYKQTMMQGSSVTTTRYLDAFGVHAELVTSAASQWNEYLMVGGSMIGVRVERSDETVTLHYFHQDHLGSIAVVSDENGVVFERDAYDTWGKRRFASGPDDPTGSIQGRSVRGFTGQEMLDSVTLVHLNGRVYDPVIGRMLSADPVIGDPLNGQTWNRYSYVYNNPLAYTDPTGYCPNCIGYAYPQVAQSSGLMQLVESAFKIAVSAMCVAAGGGCIPFLPLVVGVSSAYIAGVTSGSLSMALKAGIIAGATAVAFNAVGDITTHNPAFGTPKFFGNVAGHALVGCASSAASGGKCGPGALSAAVTAFAGPLINGKTFSIGSLLLNTTLGGLASVAGGGKFANGAVTAAFGYLFNQLNDKARQSRAIAEDKFNEMLDMFRKDNNFVVDTQVHALFELSDHRWIEGVADAVIIDKSEGTVTPWKCKGGLCSSYTPNQRLYLGEEVIGAYFRRGENNSVGNWLNGAMVGEGNNYTLGHPGVMMQEGSRVSRSSVTRSLRSRGGAIMIIPVE
jgi:RHS repeat-associated protein